MTSPFDINEELEELAAWRRANENPSLTLLDVLGFVATIDSVAAHLALFDPDLVVHRGARFLASGFSEETFDGWMSRGLTVTQAQQVMNHLHIASFLQSGASDEACDWFASRLEEVWRKTIPGAEVVVEGQGYDDASVTFFEAGPRDRPSSRPPAM